MTIVCADTPRCDDEFGIASCADIVVAWESARNTTDARETVIARLRRLDGISADIALSRESERLEIAQIHDARSRQD